ncbi:DUF805 domain-containing protein [Flavobacterium sp. CFBP9031]|jgi:uncharacterized membrane protein YhaH (DUF805 family)|uniref:DUF805 domain-containing protein n=1 Tax=Flavobacterium sp. CFBP9031 TaxID=3096538 RepID=UPI002A6B21CD|nr:DUF805 domain-containing protein [Flavobacterium sp. CFBP9031]MDY0990381.1 DUF805 domain-containing protein [Flavobacterium sp. CFBP9031]
MIEWYKIAMFQNYSNFSGRARRSEYWYFRLATAVIFFVFIALAIIVSIIGGGFLGFPVAIGLIALYSLIALIPSLAVTVRRMHDLGKSGWNVLISFIPLVGPIWFLVLLATEGEHGENYYGPDPKSTIEEIDEIGINN